MKINFYAGKHYEFYERYRNNATSIYCSISASDVLGYCRFA